MIQLDHCESWMTGENWKLDIITNDVYPIPSPHSRATSVIHHIHIGERPVKTPAAGIGACMVCSVAKLGITYQYNSVETESIFENRISVKTGSTSN